MPAKILVVDDELPLERLIRQQFRKKIRANEFDFVFAHNGIEALEKIKTDGPIDMVLTDLNMPEMDGLMLLDKLKEVDWTIQAVVVSAYGDMKNIRKAMNRGAFDFLTKPIDFKDLEITIQKTLEYVQQIRQNIKDLNQAQAKLLQSEKMASIGEVVAGVAHEINNPLGCIAGNLSHTEEAIKDVIEHLRLYQQQYPNPGEQIQQHSEEIELDYLVDDLPKILFSMKGASDRIRQISLSLRTFSRSDTTYKVAVNIHQCIDSAVMILRHRLKAKETRPAIELIKEYGDLPILVECYPGQLSQVFMNIIANAIDAIDEYNEGISMEQIKANPNWINIKTEVSAAGDTILIRIKDNGKGMAPEIQEHVFDHLFTTKPVGTGTGLGLSISRQIVEDKHGGKLKCISSPGEGAEFEISIPLSVPKEVTFSDDYESV